MERAQPGAIDSLVRNYELGDALGQFSDGWVVPASEPTASAQRSDLDETAFTAFDQTSSSSSLTVTIGPGEAFVDGWLGIDTATDVELAASTAGQTVGVSWDPDAAFDPNTDADRDAADRVVVALESDVSSLDPFLPLWTFDTDGSGVTSVVDERQIGSAVTVSKAVADEIDAGTVSASQSITDATGTTYSELSALQKVTYRQATAPTSPSNGETWYDTDSGIFRVYADLGDGAEWRSIPPVAVTEEAATFTESDVTLTHNSTEIQLITGSTVSRPADGGSFSTSTPYGFVINPNVELGGVEATISSQTSGITRVRLLDHSDGTLLTEKTGLSLSAGDTVELTASLESGTEYELLGDANGADYTRGDYDVSSGEFPYTSADVDMVTGLNGVQSEQNSFAANFVDIDALFSSGSVGLSSSQTTGDVVVEWSPPTDIRSWDLATYQRTLDNETVTVDVEDGNGNVLFSDIGQNFDISTIDTSKNVRLRANFSRSDTSNNPTLDYAARRFTR